MEDRAVIVRVLNLIRARIKDGTVKPGELIPDERAHQPDLISAGYGQSCPVAPPGQRRTHMTCVRQNQESCGGALRMLKTRAFWDLFFMIMLIQGAVGGVFQGLHLLQHFLVQHL